MDSRYLKLADVLTQHSIDLKKGERVLIDVYDIPEAMVIALIHADCRSNCPSSKWVTNSL